MIQQSSLLRGLYHNIVNFCEHRLNFLQKQFWRRRRRRIKKNMKNGIKRYRCIRRVTDTIRYFSWYKGVVDGCINGLSDTKKVGTKVSEIAAVHRDEFGEKFLDDWLNKILSLREELEAHKTRRSAFSGIGAEVIHWELEQRKIRDIPSIPTIARILFRYGKTGNKQGHKGNGKKQPYPYFKAENMGELHQTDLVGPRYLRGTGFIHFIRWMLQGVLSGRVRLPTSSRFL